MLSNEIRLEFLKLKVCGQRSALSSESKLPKDTALIEYLRSLLDSGSVTEPEDIGFCLWNISDNLAFLRDSDALHENIIRFRDFTYTMPAPYSYWCICDGTQRATLIQGGYGDSWYETYHTANLLNRHITPESENIIFSTHRTAVTYPPALGKIDVEQLDYAFDSFGKFLSLNRLSDQYDFHKLIYESALMQNYGSCNFDLAEMCAPFYEKLPLPKIDSPYLIGEWQYQNAPRCPHDQAVVGILAVVNALIYTSQLEKAKQIYETSRNFGLASNHYTEKRLYPN